MKRKDFYAVPFAGCSTNLIILHNFKTECILNLIDIVQNDYYNVCLFTQRTT